ncbi:MAG TPA: ATP-binding protein [Candidatus Sulfotelmatobacter sp.]|jgi:signal transduction histidine kinase
MTKTPNIEPGSGQAVPNTTLRFASFSLVLVTIIALAAVAYFTERGIVVSRDWVIHTYQVQSKLRDLQLEIMQAEASEAGLLLMQGKKSFTHASTQSDLVVRTIDELRRLTRDNPNQQERLAQLGQLLAENASLIGNQAGSQSNSAAIEMQTSAHDRPGNNRLNSDDAQIEAVVKSMQEEEETLLEQRLKDWNYLFHRNVLMLLFSFAVVALMLAYNFRALVIEVAQSKSEVAESKNKEQRVRANAESYRLMSARILELQDLERRRIARELHDSVGQYLAGLKINLNQIQTNDRIDASKMIHETIALTDYAIQEVRTISHLLHPPLLEELGFLPAARWYVDEYGKRSQVKVSLHVDEPIERLPREVEIALFRVLQEALTNVYRHASAQTVDVRIVCSDGYVALTVADDGKGIPQDVLAKFRGGAASGIGLAGMRERLAEFGGQIDVESSSAGAVVRAVIPTKACTQSSRESAYTL